MAFKTNAMGGTYWVPDPEPTQQTALQPTQQTQPAPTMNSSMTGLSAATSGPAMDDVWVGAPEGTGAPMIRQGAYEAERMQNTGITADQDRMRLASDLQRDAEQRRLGYLSTIMGTTSSQPNVVRGGPAADEEAARAAAFARAKEQAGSTAAASLKALQDVLANSGRMGGSLEASMTADVVGGAGNQVNEFTRDQLMLDLNRAADISDMNFQGGIQQRGQNLAMLPSLAGLISASGGLY